jgi:mono/diheme cytochrome c family protein
VRNALVTLSYSILAEISAILTGMPIKAAMLLMFAPVVFAQSDSRLLEAPRVWNDRDLRDWATPVAGLNIRPGHFSEKDYYSAPVGEFVRTYPVYFPGREPDGYWEMIRNKKPEPLIRPGARTPEQWLQEGRRIFHELDLPYLRNYDAKVIELVRSAEECKKLGGHAQEDGTILAFRWVPTSAGLALSHQDCAACHRRVMSDGSIVDGAPAPGADAGSALTRVAKFVTHDSRTFLDFFSPGETRNQVFWRWWAAPWVPGDINDTVKSPNHNGADIAGLGRGVLPRFNGSPYYPTKTPDLIGIKDRKYIDHTATHLLRGPEDLMRYAALVSCCDSADFGEYHMLTEKGRRILYRFPDELLYALAQYIYSLQPPANPNLKDPRAAAGRKIFEREGCGNCHTAPAYTNNKLTIAEGFRPSPDHPLRADILPISVATDPGLALKTRKGTGLYKIPSLRGVWYRGYYGHDGSVTTLEEWFDSLRLRDEYVPSGFKGYKVTHRAVPGHQFGLALTAEDKASLIAFLKTL